MFMIPKSEIPIQVSLPEQLLKIFPMIGFAPSAVSAKMLLRKNKKREKPDYFGLFLMVSNYFKSLKFNFFVRHNTGFSFGDINLVFDGVYTVKIG